ncbi:AmmeMemoRadiSam system protein B [Rosettibacter firmus]|uniref:AmmeMemoRadiSam system protein B n=1 Tax=Rosettibacter firmus TaxID=3111522 RepID=UPI00336BF2BD
MKKFLYLLLFMIAFFSCNAKSTTEIDSTRYPVFAGQFYSNDSTVLKSQIETFLNNSKPKTVDSVVAIIVPHAGYIYSGQIAADAFNQIRNNEYDLIVILGTNHTTPNFNNISVYPAGSFVTPIGSLKIDNASANELLKKDPEITTNLAVHAKEHSIEVQLPFIKYLFPNTKILPVIVGSSNIQLCCKFGKSLADILHNKKALIIASSDFSHYPDFDNAINVDNTTLKAITQLNPEVILKTINKQLEKRIPQLATCACGEAPIIAAICIAKELGAKSAKVISYSNSGYNPVGSTDRVVSYSAVAITKEKAYTFYDVDTLVVDNKYKLTLSDKKFLLKYARKTLEQYFLNQTVPLPRNMNQKLKIKRGAFVTLKKLGQLRGCIGHMIEDTPLCTVVGAMALQAAFNDTRFRPLTKEELNQIEIEISVLTPFTKIKSADDIVLGRDGVIVKKGNKQAVFLPQVATETGWSKEEFLNQLCYKAGLNAYDWKNAELFTFQAEIFSEKDFE